MCCIYICILSLNICVTTFLLLWIMLLWTILYVSIGIRVCVCLFRIQRELVGHRVCVDLFLYDQCCFLFKNSYSEVGNIVSHFFLNFIYFLLVYSWFKKFLFYTGVWLVSSLKYMHSQCLCYSAVCFPPSPPPI